MTTFETSTEQRIRDLFAVVDRRDIAALSDFFDENITFRFGSADPVAGKPAVVSVCESFLASLAGIRHEIEDLWVVAPGRVVANMTVHYRRQSGTSISLPCSNTFTAVDGLIVDYRIYMDVNPVFA